MSTELFSSAFPPDEGSFAGAIALRLASGSASAADVADEFSQLAEDFEEYFPNEEPVKPSAVPEIVDAVVAEYARCVTRTSPDAEALIAAMDRLADERILYLYGEGFDDAESVEVAASMAHAIVERGGQVAGYLYSDTQDLDHMILDNALSIGFGTFSEDGAGAEELARVAVRILAEAGLNATWDGGLDERIVVSPIEFEVPLLADTDARDLPEELGVAVGVAADPELDEDSGLDEDDELHPEDLDADSHAARPADLHPRVAVPAPSLLTAPSLLRSPRPSIIPHQDQQ